MRVVFCSVCFLGFGIGYSQGILNNGAQIVTSGAAQIYIDGNALGGYTSQAGGLIVPSTGMNLYLEGNWVNNSVNTGFGSDAGTVILNGAAQSIGGSNSTTFYNLSLQGAGLKSQLINTNVGGVVTRTGVFSIGNQVYDLNTYTLTVTNSAITAVNYGSGYVLSETNLAVNPSVMAWNMGTTTGNFVFPFGVSGTQIPFTFSKTTTGASSVSVSTRATLLPDNQPWAGISNVAAVTNMFSTMIGGDGSVPVVIDRWWDITSSAPVTANCTFSYRGVENTLTPPYNTGTLSAQHWNGTSWDSPVGSAPAVLVGVGSVTANGLSTFSPWILSSLIAPLPIELLDVSVRCNNLNRTLYWSTASEKNNDFFTIEKSSDGKNFHVIGTVKGAGNSSSIKNYFFTDPSLNLLETVYYRLSQTDYNTITKVCRTFISEPCNGGNQVIDIFNTSNGSIYVKAENLNFDYGQIDITDLLGRKVLQQDIEVIDGGVFTEVNCSDLPGSYYILSFKNKKSGSIVKSKKVFFGFEN